MGILRETYVHLWWHLAKLFLKQEMFQTKFADKIKTYFMCSKFLRKSCRVRDNVEKYGTAREATYDNIQQSRKMRFAGRVTKTIIIGFNGSYLSLKMTVVSRNMLH